MKTSRNFIDTLVEVNTMPVTSVENINYERIFEATELVSQRFKLPEGEIITFLTYVEIYTKYNNWEDYCINYYGGILTFAKSPLPNAVQYKFIKEK